MSTLLLDLGNTRLKLAALGAQGLADPQAIAHAGAGFAPALETALARWPEGGEALLASVAPPDLASRVVAAFTARGTVVTPVAVAAHASLRLCYRDPSRFGVDRWLALLAARDRVPDEPLLLAGCGTALTLDLVDAAGLHHGGLIAASPSLMQEALRARAPHLPPAVAPAPGFACDTAAALASGCTGAAVGLIERSVAAATRLLGRPPRLLLTGGGAPALLPLLDANTAAAPSYHAWLVLDGLAVLARERAATRG